MKLPCILGADLSKIDSEVLEDFVSCLMDIVVDIPVS